MDESPSQNFIDKKVEISRTRPYDTKNLGKQIYQIDISIRNTCVTPTISAQAIQKKLHRVVRLKIEGKNIKLLAAGYLTDRFRGITRKIKTNKDFIWVESGVPSFGRLDFRLLVKGNGKGMAALSLSMTR